MLENFIGIEELRIFIAFFYIYSYKHICKIFIGLRKLRASSDQFRELGALEAVVPAIELSEPQ